MLTFPINNYNLTIVKKSEFLKRNNRFLKFQLTALVATSVDFAMTILLESGFDFHYPVAVGLGATCGAITAFMINRFWVFSSMKTHPVKQAFNYSLVVGGSIFLNTLGTYLLTESTMLTYLVSKAIVSLIVGFTYSYYFSKRFVFYA